MLKHLTLIGRDTRGEVSWDVDKGTFEGYEAPTLNLYRSVTWLSHPGWPDQLGTPGKSAGALIVLLAIMGYDVPEELSDVALTIRRMEPKYPDGAVF